MFDAYVGVTLSRRLKGSQVRNFTGDGLTWANLFERPYFTNQMAAGIVFFMLLVDTILFLLLTGFMDTVRPGKYGLAEPVYFFLKVSLKTEKCIKSLCRED